VSDTQFIQLKDYAPGWVIFVADDDPEVINAFGEVFDGCQIERMPMDAFAAALAGEDGGVHKVAFFDGTFNVLQKTSHLDAWLQRRGLDARANLTLVGFSGDERQKTPRCIRWYVKSKHVRDDIRELKALCDKTVADEMSFINWPTTLPGVRSAIEGVIHTLKNAFGPVGTDAYSVGDSLTRGARHGDGGGLSEAEQKVVKSIHAVCFGAGLGAYLAGDSTEYGGGDIVAFVRVECAKLPAGVTSRIEKDIDRLVAAISEARRNAFLGGGMTSAVTVAEACQLKDTLENVSKAVERLLDALREIQKEMANL
jgi:hypothetical protein